MQKAPRNISFLDWKLVEYIKSQIETGDPNRTKRGLQYLCKLYRGGGRIKPPQLVGIEQSILGLLYAQKKHEKVRRWALNVLARLGREATCSEAVVQSLREYGHEPQTAAAAIAAIYRMSNNASSLLKTLSFDDQMITLAALQHVDADKLDLSALPLNVEQASPDLLRLALIVVGLDRAPENMLNPRHDNAQMVKVLGQHDDSIVSQYSIWAITENGTLGIQDIGIDIRTVEQQPTNVRSWIFRLIAMTSEYAARHQQYLELGMRDPEVEAKVGLAIGLKDTFFDGLEALVLDWFTTESDQEVTQNLLDHIVRHARTCPSYRDMAINMYTDDTSLRDRMEANAIGTPIYRDFKRISYNGSDDLFRGASPVTNHNTFNFSGGIQGGAVSLGGSAQNFGQTAIHYDVRTIEAIQSELSKAERELHASTIDADLKNEALEHVLAAKADPSPDKISKAITMLGKVESLATKAIGVGTAVGSIASSLGKISGLM